MIDLKESKSAVLNKAHEIEIKNTPLKPLNPTDVLVKIMAVGICGSDTHFYDAGKLGDWIVKDPLTLGHESAGIIEKTGNAVKNLKTGDRVAIEPENACGKCEYCREGRYNLCPYVQFMAIPGTDGALTQHMIWPAKYIFKIPHDMPYNVASLSEPFSVGIHASQLMDVQPGSTVFISGAGPVGLLSILATKAFGAETIISSDAEPSRLKVAKKLGATYTINVRKQNVKQEVKKYTNNKGADFIFEASGNTKAETDSLLALRRGGKIAYIGMPSKDFAPLSITYMTTYEPKIYGIFRYTNTYPLAIKVLHKNLKKAQLLLTNAYDLEHSQDAFEKNLTGKSDSLKIVIYPNGKTNQ